ncbi:transglycosylase SLT domain-containing protein [Corallococcus sp. AB030]|uniref:transglycosylase SLT domain-containing protein n=1 Tax=Corallococcus sp. AB030 TaxID=2316716 RepID=UPI001315A8F6|nr:transglycosylase SLT domain-containing protein [Corallococcus sp. AB030]
MTLAELEQRLPKHLAQWSRELHAASTVTRLCPYLLAAVCDRESLGGRWLKPRGPKGVGDRGYGLGLMQIDRRYHREFAARLLPDGTPAWQDPGENILYGAGLLLDRVRDFAARHASRRERVRLAGAIASYNADQRKVEAVLRKLPAVVSDDAAIDAMDALTTGKDYGADVLRRRAQWAPAEAPLEG